MKLCTEPSAAEGAVSKWLQAAMPDLLHSLYNRDIGFLRIAASLWGLELTASGTEAAAGELAAALLNPILFHEIVDSLPDDCRSALEMLAQAGGRLPWAGFTRQFGEIRDAGPGRRDREQVYLDPVSPSELLFYRALLARAFFDTPSGAQEFAYIPEDLIKFIPVGVKPASRQPQKPHQPVGRLASPREHVLVDPASDNFLDVAVTLLAALRMDIEPPEMSVPVNVVRGVLQAAGLLAGNDPVADQVKVFLETPRSAALSMLVEAWQTSESFNELRQVPDLVCEGEWQNSPFATRQRLLELLETIPEGKWWSLPAFIYAIKEKYPDFQRPAGDYDSWFIKHASDGVYLRGFASWDEVEGALIRYLVTGPLHWLGGVDLALAEEGGLPTAFRRVKERVASSENGKIVVASNGRISVPRSVPRVTRYLISRFCEWEENKPDEYRYRVSTGSLKKAGEQRLKVSQLLSLLAKNAVAEIPPSFVKALKRWENNGTEARVETQTVLRVSRPEVLEEMRKSKAGRFLGEAFSPTAVIVKPGAQSKVLAVLAEMGLLAEDLITIPPRTGADKPKTG